MNAAAPFRPEDVRGIDLQLSPEALLGSRAPQLIAGTVSSQSLADLTPFLMSRGLRRKWAIFDEVLLAFVHRQREKRQHVGASLLWVMMDPETRAHLVPRRRGDQTPGAGQGDVELQARFVAAMLGAHRQKPSRTRSLMSSSASCFHRSASSVIPALA